MAGPSVNSANEFQTLTSMSIDLYQTLLSRLHHITARAGFGLDDK
jgi:hypothetical protein